MLSRLDFLKNSGWLFFEKIIRAFINIFVWIWIANFLGPYEFGVFNYAITIVSILIPFSSFGIENIIVKKIVENDEQINSLMGSSFLVKIIGSIFVVILSFLFFILTENSTDKYSLLVIIISFSSIFQIVDVIDYYYQAKLKQKITSIAKLFSFLFSTILRIFLIIYEADLYLFALAYTFEFVLYSSIMLVVKDENVIIGNWEKSIKDAFSLIKESIPLLISNLSIILIMKVDLIILNSLSTIYNVGLYSFAIKLTEPLIMFVAVLTTSYFPLMMKKNINFKKQIAHYYKWITILTYVIILIYGIFINIYLINFSQKYAASLFSINIRLVALIFISFEMVNNTWYLSQGILGYKIKMVRYILALILNTSLNYLLIINYGMNGAAISFLFTYFFIGLLTNAFNKKTFPLFIIQLRAIILKN